MTRIHALPGITFILSLLILPLTVSAGPLEDNARQVRKLAEQGDAKAQSNLGYLYYVGEGVPQDYSQAVTWYRKAATQGDKDAQYNLAVAYAFGEGIQQDLKEASIWYRRSAEQGHVISQYSLGLSYAYGEGIPQDSSEAARWFQKAAEQGYIRAQVQLGSAYHTGEGVPQDYSQAIHWYRMAADRGDATAQYNLGTLYRSGKGVEQNYQQAIRWFTMAADQGYAAAQNELASLQRTAGQVASRPTPQIRPGTDQTAPGIETTPITTAPSVSTATDTTSPIATRTDSAKAQPEEAVPVEVAQTPATTTTAKSSGGISQPAAATKTNEEPAESGNKGGLFGAIGSLFKSPEPVSGINTEVDVKVETTPEPVPETEVATAVAQTPAKVRTIETKIHKEITIEPEQVEVISNMPQTDSLVRTTEAEDEAVAHASSDEDAIEEKPGFLSRLFGKSARKDETPEPAETIAVESASEEVTEMEIAIDPQSVRADETVVDKEAVEITSPVEPEPVQADSEVAAENVEKEQSLNDDPDQSGKGGIGGFFNRLFGGGDDSGTAKSPEQVALAEPSSPVEASPAGSGAAETQSFSVAAGRSALEAGQYDEAIQQFRPLAEAGDAEAQSHLASMYYVGRSVDKDYKQAFNWYRRAADQGHVDSQYSLGNMYLLGEGVKQNNHLAALWYSKAAQQGHAAAGNNLASLKRLMQQTGETLEIPQQTEVAAIAPETVTDVPAVVEEPVNKVVVEERSVEAPSVPVSSNYPETDEIVRATAETGDADEKNVEHSGQEAIVEPEVAKQPEGTGIGGFFSRLFGSSDEQKTPASDTEALAETAPRVEENIKTIDASEEPTVKTFAIESAPASQPLSSEPEIAVSDPLTQESTEIGTEKQSEPVSVTTAEAETMESTVDPVTVEAAPDSETKGPSFFERLFGSSKSDTEALAQETGEAPEIQDEVVAEEAPEDMATVEDVSQSPAEPVVEQADEIIASETTAPTEKKKGFFARLFGSGDEVETEVNSTQEAPYEELYTTEAETTDIQLAEATPSDEDVYHTGTTEPQQNTDANASDDNEFDFFDRMFGAKEEHTEPAVADSGVDEHTSVPEPVQVPGPVVQAEPVEYITEIETANTADDGGSDIGQIRPQAIQGDADAQLQLAERYYAGNGIKQDYTQAFLWYRRAAQQGNVDAQYKLGNIYLMGEGIDQDDRQAALWYEKAASQGHEAARHNYENLQRLAAAQTVAAIEEEKTPDVAQTPSLAPGAGLSSTSTTTAINNANDDESPARNADGADAKNVNQGEDKGFWDSAGEFFGIGDDDEQPPSTTAPATVEVEDSDDDDPVTKTGDAQTLYDRGMAYAFGDGVRKDYKKAAENFLQAAEQGHAGAQYRLGVAYAYGEGVERDLDKSIEWYRKAAQQGNTTAQRTIATMYLDGDGVPRDKVMAHAWYRIVAHSGNVMDIRRRDMLQQELSEPELNESERIAQEINSRLHNL